MSTNSLIDGHFGHFVPKFQYLFLKKKAEEKLHGYFKFLSDLINTYYKHILKTDEHDRY